MIKGRVRTHTANGYSDFAAGKAFHWGPEHAPEALDDSQCVDFSPTEELGRVIVPHRLRGQPTDRDALGDAALQPPWIHLDNRAR